jgi:putative membrane protein insertion efficiency factor
MTAAPAAGTRGVAPRAIGRDLRRFVRENPNPLKLALVLTIRAYQKFISPALPRACKYHPSCSQYAVDALQQYGLARGVVLATWRLLRCNPLSYGGYDPVEAQKLFRSRPKRAAGDQAPGGTR